MVNELQRPAVLAEGCQHALKAMSFTSGATPTIPIPLLAAAAIRPATCVPCRSPRKAISSLST
jgi:hypothetical protein